MRAACLALALALAGCAPSDIGDLQPLDVTVHIVGTTTVTPVRPRLSALLIGQMGFATLDDIALTSTTVPAPVRLRVPPASHETAIVFQAPFANANGAMLIEPVRFALYDDLDGSESLQDGDGIVGPDQVLAVDEPPRGYGWVPELEEQLALQQLPSVSVYYDLTDDRYTAFVPLFRFSDGSVTLDASTTSVSVDVSQVTRASTRLACGENFTLPRTEDILRLWVGDALDPEAVCGLQVADCTSVRLEELEPSEFLPPAGDARDGVITQCRRRGAIETVVVERDRQICRPADCACDRFAEVQAIVTATTARPDWWPCGDTIPYCASSRPLYRADPPCQVEDET